MNAAYRRWVITPANGGALLSEAGRMGIRGTMDAPASVANVGDLPIQIPHVGDAGRGWRAPSCPNPLTNPPHPPARRLRIVPLRIGHQLFDHRAVVNQPPM